MKKSTMVAVAAGAAVLAVGATVALAGSKPATPANPSGTSVQLNALNSGQAFNVSRGQWIQLTLPVDPTGVVTYDTSATFDPPAGMFDQSGATEGPTGFRAQVIGPGTWPVQADVLTNGTKTGTIAWTIVAS